MELSERHVSSGDQNSDLSILSKELKVDKKLKFSNKREEFKEIITDSVKPLTTLEQKLEKMKEMTQKRISLPNNYVFATISEGLYADDEQLYKDEDGQDLHGQIVHPGIGNWKLIRVGHDPCSTERTAASINGYCGAAYWNEDTQQVIIAHCGTKNKEGVYNDIYGVFLNEHVPQIDSAVTFTDDIIRVLSEINNEKGSNIQLFFTGHSLGAWLACITAFSAKFLHRNEDDCFVSNTDFEDSGYHSSAVIFDGPGCKKMLERIQNRLMSRYGNRRTISSLDIKNYLSAPNLINACNIQVGDVYRLFIPLTDEDKAHLESLRNRTFFQKILGIVKKHSVEMHAVVYTCIMHKMENIKKVFCNETGEVLDDNGNLRIQKVIDWPLLISGSEKEAFKNKLMQGGMDKLSFFQRHYTEVFGNLDSTTELVMFGFVCGSVQTISSSYNLTNWYKDLIHELDNFFKVAHETNNYDPVEVSSSGAGGRYIRYKTEYVDENYRNTHTLNVFKYCELKFLEQYKTLEEYNEYFNGIFDLKEVFSVFKKDEKLLSAVMDVLKGCKIVRQNRGEIGVIYSENVREYISYIKNLLHLFPEIQQKVSNAFKDFPKEASERYYSKLSDLYLESLGNYLELKEDTLGLKSFLEDIDIKILHLTTSCTTFEAERANKTLKIMCNNFLTYKHIFLNLSRIFYLGHYVFINYLTKLDTNCLLCIECDISHNTVKSFLGNLFEILQQSDNRGGYKLKIILITKKESDISRFIKKNFLNCKSIYREEESEVCFDVLNPGFQEKLLDKTVLLQGKEVSFRNAVNGSRSLNDIISPDTIVDLYQGHNIKIGKELSSFGDAENLYINRQVVQKVKVAKNILCDRELIETNTIIAVSNSSKEELSNLISDERNFYEAGSHNICSDQILILDESNDFESLCSVIDCSIHWLEKKGDDLIWKRSHGKSFDVLRKHIERYDCALKEDEFSVENTSVKLVNFDGLNDFEEKLIVIAAEPGMGKTTAFTHLEKTWFYNKTTHPSQWLVRINLVEYKKELGEEKQFKSALDIINFFFNSDSKLTKKLMESRLLESGGIVFLLDGFDEISSNGQKNIVDLLKMLLQHTRVERVFISTRFHLRDALEDNFSTLVYTFKPLFWEDQADFLQKFWKEDFPPDMEEAYMQNFISRVLDHISKSIGDNERAFMSIPLQMRMVAEVVRKAIKDETFMDDPKCIFSENFTILQLYNWFVSAKYREYFKKMGAENIVLDDDIDEDWFTKTITEKHRIIALKTLFPEDASKFNCEIPLSEVDKLKINRIGIAQIINDKPDFLHRTFAEYYVASFLAHRLHQKQNNGKCEITLKFLKKEIFEKRNEVIKRFLTYQLAKDELFCTFLAEKWDTVGNIISDPQRRQAVDALGRNIWHYVAECLGRNVEVSFSILSRLINFDDLDLGKKDYLEMSPLDYMRDYISLDCYKTAYLDHNFQRHKYFEVSNMLFHDFLGLLSRTNKERFEHEITDIEKEVAIYDDNLDMFKNNAHELLDEICTRNQNSGAEETFSVSLEECSFREKYSKLLSMLYDFHEAYNKIIIIFLAIVKVWREENYTSIPREDKKIINSIILDFVIHHSDNSALHFEKMLVWHIFVIFKRLHKTI